MNLRVLRQRLISLFREQAANIYSFIQKEKIDRILLVLLLLVTTSAIAISTVEPDLPLSDAVWWSVVTLTTVGYGDISPVTYQGRVIAAINMFVGIGILSTFSATIASILVDKKIMEQLGKSSYKFSDHLIVCEWNYQAQTILKELRFSPKTKNLPIILVANIERKPIDDEHLYFIQGDVSDVTLKRANIEKAKTVIILGDTELSPTNRDAKAILSTLTVESINPDVYTIVELVNEAYASTCTRANADEVIVSSELSSKLISQAALHHGITKVVSNLLSSQTGNQLYKVPMLQSHIGSSFLDVFIHLKQQHKSILVAVQQDNGEVIENPPNDYQLTETDFLIVIADKPPKFAMTN